jgi:hypothetical protein
VLPCPLVLKRHELIHIYAVAIDEAFILNIDSLAQVIFLGAFFADYTARHRGTPSCSALRVTAGSNEKPWP